MRMESFWLEELYFGAEPADILVDLRKDLVVLEEHAPLGVTPVCQGLKNLLVGS